MADLAVRIIGDSSGIRKSLSETSNALSRFKSGMSNVGKSAAGVFGGLTAAAGASKAVSFLQESVKAAQEDQKAQAVLAQTLKNTTGARAADIKSVEQWVNKTQAATGILDDHLRPALGSLVRATGDVGKAQNLMKTAMDVSTATGKPLETVAVALSKAYQGNVSGLGRLGIATKDASGKTLTFAQVQDQLNKKFGGATSAAANTAAGKMAILKARFSEIQESIGGALIPILSKLADIVVKVAGFFEKHSVAAKLVAVVIGGALLAAVIAYTASMVAAAAATIAAMWPVIAIIAAIAALVVGIKFAIDHWHDFRDAVIAVVRVVAGVVAAGFAIVKQVIVGVIEWVKTNWPLLLAILTGPFGLAVYFIKGHFNDILGFIKSIPGRIVALASAFLDAGKALGRAIVNGIKAGLSAVAGFAGDVAGAVLGAVKGAWNRLARTINDFLPNSVGVGPFKLNFPDNPIPSFSGGGIVPGPLGAPVFAMVHGGERILAGAHSGSGGGSPVINVAIYNPSGNGDQIGDQLLQSLKSGRNAAEFRRVMAGV